MKYKKFFVSAIVFVALICFSRPVLAIQVKLVSKLYSNVYANQLCQNPDFDCVVIQKQTSWKEFFPNEKERALIMKLNRYNEDLKIGMPVAIPKDLNKELVDFSPFPKQMDSDREKVLIFDPRLFGWAAYESDGRLVRWGPAIGGAKKCPEDANKSCLTVVGEFRVILKGGQNYRSNKYPVGCGSKNNPCAPMSWYMKFYYTGYGFHGSDQMVGWHASHGCIRLFVDDAEWLNKNFVEIGTKVTIKPYK